MTCVDIQMGTATYGRPRPRKVRLEPKPTVCPACKTDTDTSPCPQNCPTREESHR